MTIERRTHPNRRYPRGRYPIVVALALLLITGVVVFLFIIGQEAPKHEPCSPPDAMKGGLSIGGVTESAAAFGAPLAFFSETPSPVVEATLSDDLDHDGKPDGMADPLGVLLGALVVFATRVSCCCSSCPRRAVFC